jgi:hypothetical protein
MSALFFKRLPQAMVAIFTSLAAPHVAADVFHSNTSQPFAETLFVRCANGGTGELVDLSGQIHEDVFINTNKAGKVVVRTRSQLQGVSGIGRSSGDRYHASQEAQGSEHIDTIDNLPFSFSFVDSLRVIGQGPGNNFTAHYMAHLTVSASGNVAADMTHFSSDCK